MNGIDILTLAIAKSYTDETVVGGGALKGKNCTISDISPITGGNRITFQWTLDDGTVQTDTLDVMDGQTGDDGVGIVSIAKTSTSGLVDTYTITLTDGNTETFTVTNGAKGDPGEDAQKSTLPEASASEEGNIYQYVGETTATLINGYFYKCVEESGSYSWVAKSVQEGGSGGTTDYSELSNKPQIAGTTLVGNKTLSDLGIASATDLDNKVDKISGKGLSTNDYTDEDKAEVAKVADKADADDVIDSASYDSANHQILFKNGTTTLFSLDAAAFVKDGMVDDVEISGGNLVITFNTDAGKQAISIPLTDIFDPANYYDKDDVDGLLADKADKVASATNGDFAGLDANGNLTDSGKKASDFGTADEIADIVNVYGSKNLLAYPYDHTTQTVSGITFTDLGDGRVTANGTATADSTFLFHFRTNTDPNNLILPNGKYILTGCPSGGSTSTYYVGSNSTVNGAHHLLGNDVGNGVSITLDGDDYDADSVDIGVYIQIKSGITVTNLTFKPMIRLASIEDSTWVPYVPTNKTLHEEKVSYDDASESVQKNLIPYPYTQAGGVYNGVTVTDNGDGSLKFNGTATSVLWYGLQGVINQNYPYLLKKGTYIFSMEGLSGNLQGSIYAEGQSTPISGLNSSLTSRLLTVTSDVKVFIGIRVGNGDTVSNVTIKPMLRKATIKDDTWEPYVPNNTQLTTWKANGILGAKNLIPYPYYETTKTVNGITFTDLGDGTIKANGTATANANIVLRYRTENVSLKAGRYILTGCPKGGGTATYSVWLGYNYTTAWEGSARDTGDGATFSLTSTKVIQMQIEVLSGQTVSNLIFKPMIRLAEDTDDTYQPYAMSNRELTDRVIQSVESITLDNTTTNAGSVKLYRYGNLRVLTGYFRPTVAGTSDANAHIADLPSSADYPQFDVPGVCGRGAGSSTAESKIGNILALAAGSVVFQGKDVGENMFFNITWVVA